MGGDMISVMTAIAMTPKLETFLWAFCASLAVEVLDVYAYLKAGTKIPARYRTAMYWVVRLLLGAIAGLLAVAHNITENPLLAMNIGAATPVILRNLEKRMRHKSTAT